MKMIYALVILVFFSFNVLAEKGVVKLKSGKIYRGEIVDINEVKITIKTKGATRSYPWSRLDRSTIKKYNPALYDEMLAEAKIKKDALIRERGYVQHKGKWVLPAKKAELEKIDQGLIFFEEKWQPTNEVAKIKFLRLMKAQGKTEYDGKWFTEKELEEYKENTLNKGLKIGMSEKEVIAKWGKPTRKSSSQSFKTQKLEMWFYIDKKKDTEDRVIFKMHKVRNIQTNKDISEEQ